MEKAGRRILQQKTERRNVFPKISPRENETTVRVRCINMRLWLKLQIKLGKAQENEEVPEVLSVSSLWFYDARKYHKIII